MITRCVPLISGCVMNPRGPGDERTSITNFRGNRMVAVVLLLRRGSVPIEMQERACIRYCEHTDYWIKSVTFEPTDAALAVEGGHAAVVLAAYRRSEDREMYLRVQRAGGRVEYTRSAPTARTMGADDLVAALHERGASVEQIAELLGESTRDIGLTLSRPDRR